MGWAQAWQDNRRVRALRFPGEMGPVRPPWGRQACVVGGRCSVIVNPGKTNRAVKEDACGIHDPRKQGFLKFENLLEKYGGIETYMGLGRLLQVNTHHMYLHPTPLPQTSRCVPARRREIASHTADIKLSYCPAGDFSGKSEDSCGSETENPAWGPSS